MSSNLMDTEKGGEQTQHGFPNSTTTLTSLTTFHRYEGAHTEIQPHKKSGGQLGDISTTTDPSKTDAAKQQAAERGEQTAENIRYGQTISEGGMSGFTTGQQGEATQGGYGKVQDGGEDEESEAAQRREVGLGGSADHNREVGA